METTTIMDLNELLAVNDDEHIINKFNSSKYYDIETFKNNFSKLGTAEYLSIINVNIRSFLNNKDNLLATISALGQDFDIVTLQETWLDEHIENLANIESYTSYFKHKYQAKYVSNGKLCSKRQSHSQ